MLTPGLPSRAADRWEPAAGHLPGQTTWWSIGGHQSPPVAPDLDRCRPQSAENTSEIQQETTATYSELWRRVQWSLGGTGCNLLPASCETPCSRWVCWSAASEMPDLEPRHCSHRCSPETQQEAITGHERMKKTKSPDIWAQVSAGLGTEMLSELTGWHFLHFRGLKSFHAVFKW